MSNLILPYEYFSGANVVLSIEDFPVSQAAGMSMQIQESKTPIYGYSSRHFDAVARGRVLVSGSLIINYVHQNYLYELISMALQGPGTSAAFGSVDPADTDSILRDALGDPTQARQVSELLFSDYVSNPDVPGYFKEKYWDNPSASNVDLGLESVLTANPHDSFGGMTLDASFGERSDRTGYAGVTGFRIHEVYFVGRGMAIQIDENTIVEEYSWFGRNLTNLPRKKSVQPVFTDEPAANPQYVVT